MHPPDVFQTAPHVQYILRESKHFNWGTDYLIDTETLTPKRAPRLLLRKQHVPPNLVSRVSSSQGSQPSQNEADRCHRVSGVA